MRQKLVALQKELNQGLVGREETIRAALLAMVAGENALLIGPPGTAKSLLARRLSQAMAPVAADQPAYFEYLLTKFSTPEELFGPLSLTALKQDRFHRNTTGYLPTVQVAFLDEIFKASSSILNSLLTILNERKFHNGTEAMAVPLQTLVAASNELPRGQPELSALYDRFLIRRHVDYLAQEQLSALFEPLQGGEVSAANRLTVAELADLQQRAEAVVFSEEIRQAVREIWTAHAELFKENAEETLSDRRFVKVLHVLRISAASNGRSEVDLSDLVLLKDCLWSDEANAPRVHELVLTVVKKHDRLAEDASVSTGKGSSEDKQNQKPVAAVKPVAPPKSAALGTVIKGFKGSGTESDPLLIENLENLQGLERKEVSEKGYHFQQTCDIDTSELTTWFNIENFIGTYHGGNFLLIGNSEEKYIFNNVENSRFSQIKLHDVGLSKLIKSSDVTHSEFTKMPFLGLGKCNITYCTFKEFLGWAIVGCNIHFCFGYSPMAYWHISGNSIISNNLLNLDYFYNSRDRKYSSERLIIEDKLVMPLFGQGLGENGGVSSVLEDSKIINLYFTGSIQARGVNFLGLFANSKNSAVEGCAVGQLNTNGSVIRRRIVFNVDNHQLIKGNVALDILESKYSDEEKRSQELILAQDGKSVSAVVWKQNYFENHMNWDFDTIWQWNDAENRPELRPQPLPDWAIIGSMASSTSGALGIIPEPGQTSLLLQQLQANLWLAQA